jgi:hypothetical protein
LAVAAAHDRTAEVALTLEVVRLVTGPGVPDHVVARTIDDAGPATSVTPVTRNSYDLFELSPVTVKVVAVEIGFEAVDHADVPT